MGEEALTRRARGNWREARSPGLGRKAEAQEQEPEACPRATGHPRPGGLERQELLHHPLNYWGTKQHRVLKPTHSDFLLC